MKKWIPEKHLNVTGELVTAWNLTSILYKEDSGLDGQKLYTEIAILVFGDWIQDGMNIMEIQGNLQHKILGRAPLTETKSLGQYIA